MIVFAVLTDESGLTGRGDGTMTVINKPEHQLPLAVLAFQGLRSFDGGSSAATFHFKTLQAKARARRQRKTARARRLREMLHSVGDLKVPNPLDYLVDELGGPRAVAELTGRKSRIVRGVDNKFHRLHRTVGGTCPNDGGVGEFIPEGGTAGVADDDECDNEVAREYRDGANRVKDAELNLMEMRLFNEGFKDVAIISSAASQGISLHADRRLEEIIGKPPKKRIHVSCLRKIMVAILLLKPHTNHAPFFCTIPIII